MDRLKLQIGMEFSNLRKTNAAWQLLASPLAPYVLTCLKQLFEPGQPPSVEDMERTLANILENNAHDQDIEENPLQQARREIREWTKRGLIIERSGKLIATDDLQQALEFVDGLQDRVMTSTASRLGTVQREIADLALQLSPDASKREEKLLNKIQELQNELDRVRSGTFEVRDGESAIEGIREVYDLATSLRSDFRRVEDSFREAERDLRHSLITDEKHRGQAIDSLLNSHDELIATTEGQVFSIFHKQLRESSELDRMRTHLKEISNHKLVNSALTRRQRDDLTGLVLQLITESKYVMQARTRSEKDVKGFIQSGLAFEHFRVGRLLAQVLEEALNIDWSAQRVRRMDTPLKVLATNVPPVPTPHRLRIANIADDDDDQLDLTLQSLNLQDLDSEFWESFNTLNRQDFFNQTLSLLENRSPMSIAEVISSLNPEHDLEAISYLLGIAREVGDSNWADGYEEVELNYEDLKRISYRIPNVPLSAGELKKTTWESV
ncbi:MAG: DUF3375 family protein [Pseudomonadales bacterium]|nr:DUF3375 family protein [Pseudomonadales bacterium]